MTINVPDNTVRIDGNWSTVGMPKALMTNGILYYEVEILKEGNFPQIGFALEGILQTTDEGVNDGVGDYKGSWAVDGIRRIKWSGEKENWPIAWKDGDMVGLAANVLTGTIAVSINGDWTGVVFQDDTIKQGVYPCFSSENCLYKIQIKESDLAYNHPTAALFEVWHHDLL